jgi:hypothetical protein
MTRKLALILSVLSVSGCATLESPDASNTASYCTPENAFRLGTQSRAYLGNCPKDRESAFLASLQRGRVWGPTPPQVWPYYEQMNSLEKQLVAAGSEPEREQLRARLRDAEWWAIQIINSPGNYSNFN